MDDPVQPPEGQGETPYAQYLERITDDEARLVAEEAFREWDAGTTKRFQESSEYRKQWEPYEQLGVNKQDPGTVEWALQFAQVAQDNPAAIQEWFQEYAQQHNLTPAEKAAAEQDWVDPSVQQLVEQQLQAALNPYASQLAELAQWRDSQEQSRAQQEAAAQIESQLESIKSQHPDDFNREMIDKFIPAHMDDPQNAVNLAFKDWQMVRAQIERETLQGKADMPPGAVSGGSGNGAPDPPPRGEALKWATAQALEQLRAGRG